MSRRIVFLFFLLLPALLWAKGQTETAEDTSSFDPQKDYFPDKTTVDFARNFTVEYHGHYKLVTVRNSLSENIKVFRYILLQRGTPPPEGYPDANVITIPVESMAALSTTYLYPLYFLDELDSLDFVDYSAYATNTAVIEAFVNNKVREIGSGPALNWEPLIIHQPDLVMVMSTGTEYDSYPRLQELNLPVVINADWLEKSPLGRAEWIKFIAFFFNKEKQADDFFRKTVEEYNALAHLAEEVPYRPTVLTSAPYGSSWGVTGAGSYLGNLIHDAGGQSPWPGTGTKTLLLDPESVYLEASDASVWLVNSRNWSTLSLASSENPRFQDFQAFRDGNVFNNDRRVNGNGGNDYWESGPYFPQRVLADLISIIHPGLLGDYTPYYYRRVNP